MAPFNVLLQPRRIELVSAGPEEKISKIIAPERIRTSDLTVRSRVLYPAELPVRNLYRNKNHGWEDDFCQEFCHLLSLSAIYLFGVG